MPWCNLSPSELLMGRRLRSLLPLTDNLLIPQWPYLPEFRKANERFKSKHKETFDKRHHTRERSPLRSDCEVWVTSGRAPLRGRVVPQADTSEKLPCQHTFRDNLKESATPATSPWGQYPHQGLAVVMSHLERVTDYCHPTVLKITTTPSRLVALMSQQTAVEFKLDLRLVRPLCLQRATVVFRGRCGRTDWTV